MTNSRPTSISVLADYLRRIDEGERVDKDALIREHPELAEHLRAYFEQEQRLWQAARPVDTVAIQHSPTPGRCIEVRCPHCHTPQEVAVDAPLTDLTCNSCGSHFSIIDQNKATWEAPSLSIIGRFQLIERLGVGGFGTVWKARDKQLDRTVAVKIPRRADMDAQEAEKFLREARAAAQLRHPNIVSVHEVGRDGDSVYIVSDFVRGVTLADWMTGKQLTSRETAEICIKIAEALHHAHENGVVHRDLKPANVMIDAKGEPYLMDFGLARRDVGEVTVTIDGQVLGTPAYMSPEQAAGEAHRADRRSDIYSLGVILFQLLTGELPFRGNARMLIHQVIHDDPPSPRKLNGHLPKDVETISLKCLDKNPTRRYQSAIEVADELRRHLAGEPILARPASGFERAWRTIRKNPIPMLAVLAVALISVVVILAIAFAIVRDQRNLAVASEREAKRQREILDNERAIAETERRRARLAQQITVAEREEAKAAAIAMTRERDAALARLQEVAAKESLVQPPVSELRTLIGQKQLVRLRVQAVNHAGPMTLHSTVDRESPDSFTAIIPAEQSPVIASLGISNPANDLLGRIVSVEGIVEQNDGRNQMSLTDVASQLQLVED